MIKRNRNKKKCNCFDFGGYMGGYPMQFGYPVNGALDYSLRMDDLANKREKDQNKANLNSTLSNIPSALYAYGGLLNDNPTLFAIGGDMQTNSADFSTGLTHIDAGGSHEESPYDGVQLGTDSEGIPNLVEEGEVVFNDYVYSRRINLSPEAKKKFHFPKKADITYADAAKKLEKEIKERPNDPISKASFKAQMEMLAEEQERQKQEMEAERAKAAFEALSPEEQTALMQRAAQEEAMAQQAAQQQVVAEAQGQPTPEELAMAQGQMSPKEIAMAQQQAATAQAPLMQACGGKINRYDDGGELVKKNILKLAKARTFDEFKEWAKKNKVLEGVDWDAYADSKKVDWNQLRQDPSFISAISKDNPTLAHALSKGYDFGAYIPDNTGNVTFRDISRGNWLAQDYEGWKDSKDPAWLEAVEKGLVKEGMRQEEIADALKQTDKYRMGSKWLQDSEDNRLRYLRTILEDPDSPDVAKNYAKKFVDENGWKEGAARDYATIFGTDGKGVRETHPGTYWHTPIEATRGTLSENYLVNPDGTVSLIEGDIDGLESVGSHAWNNTDNYTTYNYYRDPNAAVTRAAIDAAVTPEEKDAEKAVELEPNYKKETNIGMWGPAVGLGLQLAGVGKPDTSGIDAAIQAATKPAYQADWMPRGDFAVYKPDDPWFYTSPIMAQANAAYRSFDNSILPSKDASKLAQNYNTMIALGNVQRQQLDSNFDKYMKTKQYNGTIYDANQKEYGTTSRFNADAMNRAGQYGAQIALQGANAKMDADAGWYNSLYGNIGGLFNNIKQWEKYKRDHNTLADMWANGLAGTVTDKTPVASRYVKVVSAEGGKVKRKKNKKRGLTI